MNRNPYFVLSLPFFLVGLVLVAQAFVRHHKAGASLTWPAVRGTVTWANLEERKLIDGGTKYILHVEFQYEVDGMPFESSNYTFGRKTTADSGYAHGLVEAYTTGPGVDVFYNPKHPAESVLQPGDTNGLAMEGATGAALVAIALFAIWRGRGWRRMGLN